MAEDVGIRIQEGVRPMARKGGMAKGVAFAFCILLAGTIPLAGVKQLPRKDPATPGDPTIAGVFGPNVRVDDTGNLLNARGLNPKAFVAQNGTIYVVWDDGRAAPGTASQDDTYFAKSIDGGRTYGRNVPVAVTPNMTGGGGRVDVADDGTIFVVFGQVGWSSNPGVNHYFFATSVNGGTAFASPVVIDGHQWNKSCVCVGLGFGRFGDELFAGWIQQPSDALGSGFFLARSTDRGATWGTPVRKFDPGAGDIETLDLAVNPAGIIYVVWTDWTSSEVRLARSIDLGLTFEPSILVSRPGWNARYAVIAAGQAQEAYVVWSTIFSPANYSGTLFLTRVTDGGTTVLPPTKVTDVPANGTHIYYAPSVAVDGRGLVYVAWGDSRSDSWGDVYFARSIDGGQTFESNERVVDLPLNDGTIQTYPDVATNRNGSVVVVWTDARRDTSSCCGGDIYSAVPTYLPDLSVDASDISWSPPSPTEGTQVVDNATIHNIGWDASASTTARFYAGTPPASQIGTDQPLPSLAINGTASVSVRWTAPPLGRTTCAWSRTPTT